MGNVTHIYEKKKKKNLIYRNKTIFFSPEKYMTQEIWRYSKRSLMLKSTTKLDHQIYQKKKN